MHTTTLTTTALVMVVIVALGISAGAEEGDVRGPHSRGYITYKAPGHDRYHSWYQAIQERLGIANCCDSLNNDCGPVTQYRLFFKDGTVRLDVRLEDGRWYTFHGRLYWVDTPDGRVHVCRKPKGILGGGFYFYCAFVPRGNV